MYTRLPEMGFRFFFDFEEAKKYDKVKRYDVDEYGRTLYGLCYQTNSSPYASERRYATILLVCQFVEGDRQYAFTVGWYDECWIGKETTKNQFAAFDKEEILILKEQNDWGKPLDKDKMNIKQCYAGHKNNEEREAWWAYEENIDSLFELVTEAVKGRFGEQTYHGVPVEKSGKLYAIAYTIDSGNYFVCCDPASKEIMREKQFDEDVFSCRDAFIEFMNKDD